MKLFAKALPLCAVALLAGCSEAAVDDHPATPEGGVKCTYTATIDNGDTRTIVSEERNYLVLWVPGDAVSFFHRGEAANLKSNYMGTEHAPYGQFDIEGLAEVGAKEGAYHAGVSPYAEDNTYSNGAVGLTLPAEQIYRTGSYGGVNVFMTASAPAETEYTLTYSTFHGSVAFQLRGDAPIGSIRVTALPIDGTANGPYGKYGGKLTGRVTIAEPYVSSEPTIGAGEVSESERTVTLRCEEGVTLSEEKLTQFCIALLPDKYKLRVEIYDIYDRLLETKTTAMIEINRRRIKLMKELTGIKALPVPEVKPTDLSPNGQIANCYVITPAMGAGKYSFDASTMGNGEAGMQFTYATDLLPSITLDNGASADLLWQDYYDAAKSEGLVTDVAYDAATKRITFATGTTYHVGNAVVALRDAAGKILWSWHLWFADPRPAGMTSYAELFADPLDMNLGATVSATPDDLTNSSGLLYQWGRKDPIIGIGEQAQFDVKKTTQNAALKESTTKLFSLSRTTYDINGEPIKTIPTQQSSLSATGVKEWRAYKTTYKFTIAQSIQNPMTVVYNSYSGTNSGWLYDKSASYALYLWGISYTGTTTIGKQHVTKSIFDPCPYGYKVPDNQEFTFTSTTRAQYGYERATSDGSIYLPATAYRDRSSAALTLFHQVGSIYNLRGTYWMARGHSTSTYGKYFWFYWHKNGANANNKYSEEGYFKATAMAVRCVKTSNIE